VDGEHSDGTAVDGVPGDVVLFVISADIH